MTLRTCSFARPVSRAALAGLALLSACTSTPAVGPVPAGTGASGASSAQLMKQVQALVGDAECDNQTQCRVEPMGAKPCGGPSGYIAWSSKSTDGVALRQATVAQSKAEAEENTRSQLLSNCRVTPQPAAVCRPRAGDLRKTCQLGHGGTNRLD